MSLKVASVLALIAGIYSIFVSLADILFLFTGHIGPGFLFRGFVIFRLVLYFVIGILFLFSSKRFLESKNVKKWTITTLICSILSLSLVTLVSGVLGIIAGVIGLKEGRE